MWSGVTVPQSLLNVRSHFLSLPKISSPKAWEPSCKCPGGAWLPGIPREHWPGDLIALKNPWVRKETPPSTPLARGQLWHGWQWFHIGSLETNKNGCWTVAGVAFGSQGPVTAVVDGCLVMTARQKPAG